MLALAASSILVLLCARGAAAALVAAYGFDQGTGATAADTSGNNNHGSISGATWTTSGRFGGALSFDGSGDMVVVSDSNSLDLTVGMTLSAWVYPTGAGAAWRDVIYKGPNDTYYLSGTSEQGGVPAVGGTFSSSSLYGPAALAVDAWSHLAATYDGAVIRLYVNGVQVASRAQTGPIQTSTGPLSIGGDALYGQYWQGVIDEVRVYDNALSAAEIQTDLETPVGGGASDSTPPAVAIVDPPSGVTRSHAAAVEAAATDNVGVLSVEFFVDGVSIGVDFQAPYFVSWDTTVVSNASHVLTAVAQDFAGNVTTSSPVAVSTLNPAFVNEVVVPDITAATTIAFLPDGRMLVGELTERIWVVQPGANQPDPTPFLQLDSSQLFGEQGLMDILLDPNFAQNGYFYLFYTRGFPSSNNRNRLSRFTASGNAALPGSEVLLWQDDLVAQAEHHGGALAFGSDGKLYFTYGEQFVASDAQRLDRYRGKLLRINPDGSIPTDNPFRDGAGPNKDEIFAYGLRNPFRMSADPVTGRIFIADVGGNDASTAFEEINLGASGANYGWPLCEGVCGIPGVTSPIYSYPHLGRDASITGGFVYRGTQFPAEYQGSYFFGDYVQNTIQRLVFDAGGNVLGAVNFFPPDGTPDTLPVGDPVKMIEGPDGSLYYVDIGFNDAHVPNPAAIRRIRYVIANQPPVVVASGLPTSGPPPLVVNFSSAGSFDPEGQPLTYSWDFGDGTSSTEASPTKTYPQAGPYSARLTVSDGVNNSLSDAIAISVGNPPTATISSPADGTTFRAGDVITFTGGAVDPDEGPLGPAALSWTIVFHHEGHVHPIAGPIDGTASVQLSIPTSGHDFQGNTRYEVTLRGTDSTGLSNTASVTILPEKVNLTFDTVPSGLTVEISGISRQTPFVLDDLIGFNHTIHAPDQSSGGSAYAFTGWSDGGAQSHAIVVPASDQTYVATFEASGIAGLVAAYGFDQGSGPTATDSSGNGNHGSINGPTWTTQGRYGQALNFDGVNDLVAIPDANSLDLSSGMTLSAWVRPTALGNLWRDVIFKADDIYYLSVSSPFAAVPATGSTFFASGPLFGTAALPASQWSHLASTYDGSSFRLYVNGVAVASRAQTGSIGASTLPLTIGGDGVYGQWFQGTIDEVRIYNRALSAAEVQQDLQTPVGP